MKKIRTKNLGEGAYLYSVGHPFTMEVDREGKVVMEFEGHNATEAAQDYYSGAKVEAVKLIESYRTVKSKMHEKLNQQKGVRA